MVFYCRHIFSDQFVSCYNLSSLVPDMSIHFLYERTYIRKKLRKELEDLQVLKLLALGLNACLYYYSVLVANFYLPRCN